MPATNSHLGWLIHSALSAAAQFFLEKIKTAHNLTKLFPLFAFFLLVVYSFVWLNFSVHTHPLALTSIEICHENFRFGLFICLCVSFVVGFFLCCFHWVELEKNKSFLSSIGSLAKFQIAQFLTHIQILHNYISLLHKVRVYVRACVCSYVSVFVSVFLSGFCVFTYSHIFCRISLLLRWNFLG